MERNVGVRSFSCLLISVMAVDRALLAVLSSSVALGTASRTLFTRACFAASLSGSFCSALNVSSSLQSVVTLVLAVSRAWAAWSREPAALSTASCSAMPALRYLPMYPTNASADWPFQALSTSPTARFSRPDCSLALAAALRQRLAMSRMSAGLVPSMFCTIGTSCQLIGKAAIFSARPAPTRPPPRWPCWPRGRSVRPHPGPWRRLRSSRGRIRTRRPPSSRPR